jgi:hypothetical protein
VVETTEVVGGKLGVGVLETVEDVSGGGVDEEVSLAMIEDIDDGGGDDDDDVGGAAEEPELTTESVNWIVSDEGRVTIKLTRPVASLRHGE